jgi:hypothetical protein
MRGSLLKAFKSERSELSFSDYTPPVAFPPSNNVIENGTERAQRRNQRRESALPDHPVVGFDSVRSVISRINSGAPEMEEI